VLVSKVMQNLANGVEFGEKEVRAGPAPQQFLWCLLVSMAITSAHHGCELTLWPAAKKNTRNTCYA
jgi:hypothetical protein